MIRVIQRANRVPKTTESSPPMTAPRFSDSGWPEASTWRQTTATLRATDAGMALDRRRKRKTCGYSTSRSEKKAGWIPASTNQRANSPAR